MTQILEVFLEDFFGDLSLSNDDFFYWFSVGCEFRCHFADTSSEEIFNAIDCDGGVIDDIDLLSDKHHAHIFGHTLGNIIDVEGHFFCHIQKIIKW